MPPKFLSNETNTTAMDTPSLRSPPTPTGTMSAILRLAVAVAVAVSHSLAATAPAARDARETSTTVRAAFYLAADARLRPLDRLDSSLYTHLYYSALAVHPTTHKLVLPTDPAQAGLLATFSPTLKSKNRALQTLLSVGTAGIAIAADADSPQTDPAFAAMAADPASRAAFFAAAFALARDSGFDGLDVAWRFPASAVEMANFGFLVSEWRAAAPPGFLLTATVYFSNHVFDAPLPGVDYPSEAVARCLDWVNVVAFGLRPVAAGATNATAFDAPLYDRASHFSASYGVVSWIDAGVPASKVVMGLPLYARSWFLRNKANSGVGAPVVAAGPKQHGSNATGVMSYAEVQKLAAAGGGGRRAVTTTFDNASVASYLSMGDVWVAFDGAAVVAEKLAFAARRGLLGYFLWPVNYDDANLTVSRSALDAWMKNEISSNSKNDTDVRETRGPVRLPPALQSLAEGTPGPAPAPTSGSRSWLPWTKLDAFLHFGLLILVCF